METFLNIFQAISDNLLTEPAYFLGILAFIGSLALGKTWYEGLTSFIKTAVGFFILLAGSGGLTSTFRPIIDGIRASFGSGVAVVDTYFMLGQLYGPEGIYTIGNAGVWTTLAFAISFFTNVILVYFNKYTKMRTLYSTGHVLQGYSTMWTFLIYLVAPQTQNMLYTLLMGVFIGLFTSIASNMTFEATQDLTDGAGFGVAHQQMLAIPIVDKIAGKLGKKDDGVEKIEFPGALSIFSDNTVSTAVIMVLFLGPIMAFVGSETLAEVDPSFANSGLALWAYVLKVCLHFSVYMYILRQGVTLFVTELTTAFDGISQRFIKGSVPAVDCAVTFNYTHPNVVSFGFIFGFVGQLIGYILLFITGSPLFLVPGFIPLFFDNATLATYANNKGGKRAAIIIPMLSGLFQVATSFIMLIYITSVSGYELVAWPAMFDNNLMIAPLTYISSIINPYFALLIFSIILIVVHILYYQKNKVKYYDHLKENN